ncbi:MAG TPA: chromosomal replication initiator protein DnaA [Solirubrobacteraceae bacterium]|nr:chromosomal replication initiator protein DnaA [Solirubrobacteraceae bacterium]
MFAIPGRPRGPSRPFRPTTSASRRHLRAPVPDDHLPHAWRRIRSEMRRAAGDTTWQLWLEPLAARELNAGTLVVEAPAESRAWVEASFARLIAACAKAVLGAGTRVKLVARGQDSPAVQRARTFTGSAFNPRFTFDQFVIGDANRLAHAAALSVAEMPGLAYNPLFICGPPGLGKTHLLHSIANYVTDHGDGLTVLYTTAEAFTDQFVGALHTGALETFKAVYRGVGVLLVDDVQFLQSKARTEQEFFHTFNALQGAGAQLVLTSDRLPRDLDALEDRLRERFEAGLVTDVKPPDLATRRTILRKRVQQDSLAGIDPAAVEVIAETVDTNIRALEGALIRVVAYGSLTGRDVTAALAEEVLAGLYGIRPRQRTVEDIQRRICEAFGLSMEELLSTSRAAPVTWPRQVAMYLARELTDQTLPAIGRAFGGRNHTTVMHACKRTAERIATDREAFEVVRRLTEELGAPR